MKQIILSILRMYNAGGIKRIWYEFYENWFFDIFNGVDTYSRLSLDKYNLDSYELDGAYQYMPSYKSTIKNSLKYIKNIYPEIINGFFLDVGCGKGKAIIIASQEGFKFGIGCEINESLIKIGNSNLKKKQIYSRFQIKKFDVLYKDNIPNFDVCYFYNPFSKNKTKIFFQNINEVFKDKRIYLIYVNPIYSFLLGNNWKIKKSFSMSTQIIEIWQYN